MFWCHFRWNRNTKEKRGSALKVLMLHRACGLSFASRKKKAYLLSGAIYLTFCNKYGTSDWELDVPILPLGARDHRIFLFWHIRSQSCAKIIFLYAKGAGGMALFHVYDLPREILISCKVGETNNLPPLIRYIRGEKKNMKKQLAQCGRLSSVCLKSLSSDGLEWNLHAPLICAPLLCRLKGRLSRYKMWWLILLNVAGVFKVWTSLKAGSRQGC